MTEHDRRCLQPVMDIIIYDKKRKSHMMNMPDAPAPGLNDIYYCPTCGIKLEEEKDE